MSGTHLRSGRNATVERPEIHRRITREDWMPLLIAEPGGSTHSPHRDPDAQNIVVLESEMDVTLAGIEIRCRPGDELAITGGIEHAADMGPSGSTHFRSERLRPATGA